MLAFESSGSFITVRPEWTLHGAFLESPDGDGARIVEEKPFEFADGAWEAVLSIVPVEPSDDMQTLSVVIRVTPDTARRWREIGINPFLEACAQLRDHWKSILAGAREPLTLL